MFTKSKSSEPDLPFLKHDPFLDLMNKNILYLTHTIDKCLSVLKRIDADNGVQSQVDEYFDTYEKEHSPPTPPPTQGSEDSKQREEV